MSLIRVSQLTLLLCKGTTSNSTWRLCSTSKMSSLARPKVFATRSDFPKSGIEILEERCDVEYWQTDMGNLPREEFLKAVKDKDALFVSVPDKIDKEVIDAAGPNLKVIGTISVGVDHIDLNVLKERNIRLGYTPDVLTEATAELTVALLLATSRRLFEANSQIRTGGWKSWSPLWMCGPALKGSVVGIVGFGRIGQSVARKLLAFGVSKTLYSSACDKPEGIEMGAINTSLDSLLCESDFVVATCALSDRTKNLFNAEKFSLMKPTAIFVNTSRGGVVDQDALVEALSKSKIRAAGLDVMTPEPLPPDHPLLKLDNCVLLPHIGSATYQARMAMSELTANNIIAALDGKEMPAEYPL